jgi:hypothetical protein
MPRKKAKRKLNPRRIQSKTAYEVNKLAKALGVHPNTIHNMIKDGMPIIEGSYPFLILGANAQAFIIERQAKRKNSLKQDELLCMHCVKGSKPKNGVAWLEIIAPKIGNLKSYCAVNGTTKTNRTISLNDLPKFQEVMQIHTLQNSGLGQVFDTSGICETKKDGNNV